jgi:hypothetical protein
MIIFYMSCTLCHDTSYGAQQLQMRWRAGFSCGEMSGVWSLCLTGELSQRLLIPGAGFITVYSLHLK